LQEEETPEVEKKLQSCFKVISNHFVDPQKAEENLQNIHQMKDENIFTALSTLLDPCTSIDQPTAVRVRVIVCCDCDFLNVTGLLMCVVFECHVSFGFKYEKRTLLFDFATGIGSLLMLYAILL